MNWQCVSFRKILFRKEYTPDIWVEKARGESIFRFPCYLLAYGRIFIFSFIAMGCLIGSESFMIRV